MAVVSDTRSIRNSVEMRHGFSFSEGLEWLYDPYTGKESSSPMEKVTRQLLEMRWQCIQYSKPWDHKHWCLGRNREAILQSTVLNGPALFGLPHPAIRLVLSALPTFSSSRQLATRQ